MKGSLAAAFDLRPGAPIVLYLQGPKEKVWGLLVALGPAGVVLRGLDLAVFEDWMRQEAHGTENLIGLTTLFYPMGRLERLEHDESQGPYQSYADRFALEVGRTVETAAGLPRASARPRGRRRP